MVGAAASLALLLPAVVFLPSSFLASLVVAVLLAAAVLLLPPAVLSWCAVPLLRMNGFGYNDWSVCVGHDDRR